jgi:hypothetical protein
MGPVLLVISTVRGRKESWPRGAGGALGAYVNWCIVVSVPQIRSIATAHRV